eukprot:4811587-Pleurochrysis_carterae.AAC.4
MSSISGMETSSASTLVMPNWLPTEPSLSLRPGVSIIFLFSEPLNAAKRLQTEPARSAVWSISIE